MDLRPQRQDCRCNGSTAGIGFAIANTLARKALRSSSTGERNSASTRASDKIRKTRPQRQDSGVAADLSSVFWESQSFTKEASEADISVN